MEEQKILEPYSIFLSDSGYHYFSKNSVISVTLGALYVHWNWHFNSDNFPYMVFRVKILTLYYSSKLKSYILIKCFIQNLDLVFNLKFAYYLEEHFPKTKFVIHFGK